MSILSKIHAHYAITSEEDLYKKLDAYGFGGPILMRTGMRMYSYMRKLLMKRLKQNILRSFMKLLADGTVKVNRLLTYKESV